MSVFASWRLCAPSLLFAAVLVSGCDDGAQPAAVAVAAAPSVPAKLSPARSVRYVKLEALSEWNGNPWTAVAELNLLDATGATIDRKGWVASADSNATYDLPAHAIDGDTTSLWHTPWQGTSPPPPHFLTIDMGSQMRVSGFRYLARQDKTVNGTIARYRFYVSNDGTNWGDPVAAGNFADMGAPTVEKTVVFAQETQNHPPVAQAPSAQSTPLGKVVSLWVTASDADGDPLSYTATGLPAGLSMATRTGHITGTPITPGTSAVNVVVADNKGASATVAFGWTVQPPVLDGEPPKNGEARFVKLEEVTEVNGNAWGSVAEFNLVDASGANLPRKGWAASADSVDASDNANNAIDGNPGSLWHSQWDGQSPPPPHSLIVDLGHPTRIGGFRYLPRQDNVPNGTIAKFRFYTSANGVDWGQPLAEGDFSTMGAAKDEKTVMLK